MKVAERTSRCPYCGQEACVWSISPLASSGTSEVRTACGRGLSVDTLLGKTRWHLEAAQAGVRDRSRAAEGDDNPSGHPPGPGRN